MHALSDRLSELLLPSSLSSPGSDSLAAEAAAVTGVVPLAPSLFSRARAVFLLLSALLGLARAVLSLA